MKKGINDIKNIKLSSREKDDMFDCLDTYMKKHPAKDAPLSVGVLSGFFTQVKNYRYVYSIATVILFFGTGVTFAAEKALPGDILYPVKIHVNENVKSTISITPKARQKFEEEKIIKRLDEVKILVNEGKFDDKRRSKVEHEVEKSIQALQGNKQDNKKNNNKEFKNKLDLRLENIKKIDQKEHKAEVEKFEYKIKYQLRGIIDEDGDHNNNEDKGNKKDKKIKIDL